MRMRVANGDGLRAPESAQFLGDLDLDGLPRESAANEHDSSVVAANALASVSRGVNPDLDHLSTGVCSGMGR